MRSAVLSSHVNHRHGTRCSCSCHAGPQRSPAGCVRSLFRWTPPLGPGAGRRSLLLPGASSQGEAGGKPQNEFPGPVPQGPPSAQTAFPFCQPCTSRKQSPFEWMSGKGGTLVAIRRKPVGLSIQRPFPTETGQEGKA